MTERNEAVVLAHCRPFHLGKVRVDPAHRQVVGPGGSAIIEPRVMEALVALARVEGEVLSRDDLIAAAWAGNIVGDNAIQRAISRIRQLAIEFGEGSFAVKTIRGVGYRLDGSPDPDLWAGSSATHGAGIRLSRRATLAAVAAVSVGGLFATHRWAGSATVSNAARQYYDRAETLTKASSASNWNEQAMGLYRAAVEESPGFADAWGGLALTQMRLLYWVPDNQADQTAKLAKATATRAIALDPQLWRGHAARVLVEPLFGRWKAQREALERLEKRDADPELQFIIAQLHGETGNVAMAKPIFENLMRKDSANLSHFQALIGTYWRTGQLEQAERLLSQAQRRFPRNYELWNARFDQLLFGGQHDEALAVLAQEGQLPMNLSPRAIPNRRKLASILAGNDAEAREALILSFLRDLSSGHRAYPRVISRLGALGDEVRLYDVIDGYYFGEGPHARSLKRYSRRLTGFLFSPFLNSMRSAPRFRAVMQRIGLPNSSASLSGRSTGKSVSKLAHVRAAGDLPFGRNCGEQADRKTALGEAGMRNR